MGKWFVFKDAKRFPRHRWFYYREGFSPLLVRWFIDKTGVREIFDPFMGVGTTVLEAALHGIPAGGSDAFNFAYFVAKTKLTNWEDIREGEDEWEWDPPFFTPSQILGPQYIKAVKARKKCGNDLCKLWMTAALSESMGVKKDGAVLRRTRPRNFFRVLARKKRWIEEDLKVRVPEIWEIHHRDARETPIRSEGIFTSPPYLNGVDYRKVYGIEASFALGKPEGSLITSYGKDYRQHKDTYMAELFRVFSNWEFEVAGIVIANLPTPNGEWELDKEIAIWFEERGFKAAIYRGRRMRANFSFAISHFHESLVLVEK